MSDELAPAQPDVAPQGNGLLGGSLDSAAPQGVDSPEPQVSNGSWRDSLPDDLKLAPSIKDIPDLPTLVKNYQNTKSLVGKRFEDMSPEDMKTFGAKLGVPESPEQYKLLLKEGISRDDKVEGWYREQAHKLGLNQDQAQGLFENWSEFVGQATQQTTAQREEMLTNVRQELQKEFGQAMPQRLQIATDAVRQLWGPELVDKINASDLGLDANFIKGLVKAGELLAEDGGVNIRQSSSFGTSPQEAAEQISMLQSDPNFMKQYLGNMELGHKEAVAKMQKLFELAYPEDKGR